MNKKGFTLIELMAVIAILAILATISVVIVDGVMKKADTNISDLEKSNIKSAAKTYVADNLSTINTDLETNGCYTVTPQILKDEGYIDTNKDFPPLIVTKNGDKTNIEYPNEITINTSCYEDLITNSESYSNGYTKLTNGNDGIEINDGVLGGEYTGSVKNVIIPSGVSSIAEDVFCQEQDSIDEKIENLIISDTVTTIEKYSFYRCNLTNVTIPNSVTSIGMAAFAENHLTSVTIPNRLSTIEQTAFANNKLTSVTIPNSVEKIYTSAFENNPLITITNKSGNKNWKRIVYSDVNCINGATGLSTTEEFSYGTCTFPYNEETKTVTITN